MPATTLPTTAPEPTPVRECPVRASLRRTAALARAELLLLRRNRTLMSIAVLMPLAVVALLAGLGGEAGMTGEAAAVAVSSLVGMLLLFVVYYNVLSAAVARREEGVLQRLRTGEATDGEVLVALSLPSTAITLVQTVLLAVVGALALDLPVPGNPLLVLGGLLLGAAVFSGLALVTAVATRTLEAVQMTSLPVLSIAVLGAGLALPLDVLPPAVAGVAEFTPLSPVLTLVRAGWIGGTGGAELLQAALVAAAWVVLSVAVVRSRFRWSPRG